LSISLLILSASRLHREGDIIDVFHILAALLGWAFQVLESGFAQGIECGRTCRWLMIDFLMGLVRLSSGAGVFVLATAAARFDISTSHVPGWSQSPTPSVWLSVSQSQLVAMRIYLGLESIAA
jgi:hypothetical protein